MRTSQKRLSENTPSCVLVGVYRAAHSPEQVNFFQSSNASRMHTCTLTLFLPVRCPYGWAYRQEERNTAPGHTGQSGSLPVASGLPSSLFAVYRAEHYRPLTPSLGAPYADSYVHFTGENARTQHPSEQYLPHLFSLPLSFSVSCTGVMR